jgi:hypothetical protein
MVPAGIATFSVIYFADIIIRSSQKCFWFDELFTIFLCRLPTFGATWEAVNRGADFNPPLLYLLTRAVEKLFGEGLIATRLPAMVGVWVFCLCLFSFVRRRAGAAAGLIAGLFPFFTLAQYYAYEARAHGIVLGWCGLALVCWQRNREGRGRFLWLAGFGLSLLGALLTHVYAVYLLVPFVIVELYSLFFKPHWENLVVMAAAFIGVTVAVYLPLSRVYRKTMSAAFFAASHDVFQRFLTHVIGPALVVLLLSIMISAVWGGKARRLAPAAATIPFEELLLAGGFASIPLVGMLGSKISHGPMIDRYYLSSIAGYAIFVGFANSREYLGSEAARVLAGCMALLMLADLAAIAYLAKKQVILLIEPSAPLRLTTTPHRPLALFDAITSDQSGLDILVPSHLEYIYLFMYAPPSIVSRLYFAAPTDNIFYGAYERLRNEAHVPLQTTPFEAFLAKHDRFLLYETTAGPKLESMQAIAGGGYQLKSAQGDVSGVLYEYAR